VKFEAESTSVLENENPLSRCAAGICLTNIGRGKMTMFYFPPSAGLPLGQEPNSKHRTDDFIVEL